MSSKYNETDSGLQVVNDGTSCEMDSGLPVANDGTGRDNRSLFEQGRL